MDQATIIIALNALSDLYAQRDVLQIEQDTLVGGAIPDAVQIVIADIDLEYAQKRAVVGEKIAALEKTVRCAVIDVGASIKSDYLHAVYNRGRIRWDTKALIGYAIAHPEIGAFNTVGKPSVSIRSIRNRRER